MRINKAAKLREMFKKDGLIRIVGAHNGLSAKLIERHGFEGIWASGLEVSTSYAVPDANILTMTQYLEAATQMNDACKLPIVADCDTGYGNSNNAMHMVRKYEAAGIAAVCIEDGIHQPSGPAAIVRHGDSRKRIARHDLVPDARNAGRHARAGRPTRICRPHVRQGER